jgi:hypothetical protein
MRFGLVFGSGGEAEGRPGRVDRCGLVGKARVASAMIISSAGRPMAKGRVWTSPGSSVQGGQVADARVAERQGQRPAANPSRCLIAIRPLLEEL